MSDLERRLSALRPAMEAPEASRARVRAAVLAEMTDRRPKWPRERMSAVPMPRLALLVLALIGATAVAGVIARSSDSSEGLSRISTLGQPVEWDPYYSDERRTPRLLAVRSGRAFYSLTEGDKPTCFGVGTLRDGRLRSGSVTCPLHRGLFPSPDAPVMFHAGHSISAGGDILTDLEGFAADGVARVELRLPNRTLEAAVQQNTFAIDVNERNVSSGTFLAFDFEEDVVYRQNLGSRPAWASG